MIDTHKFACALNCIDGRSIAAVDAWMKKKHGVDFVDQPTKEGMVKTLAENAPTDEMEKLKYRAGISVTKHGASVIAVVAHEHCAGNPVSVEEQLDQVKTAVEEVALWNLGVPVVGLFVSPQGSEWKVREIETWRSTPRGLEPLPSRRGPTAGREEYLNPGLHLV